MIRLFPLYVAPMLFVLLKPSPLAAANREAVVVDDSGASGKVHIYRDDGGHVSRQPVLEGVRFFQCAPTGYFVAQARSGKWCRGFVGSASQRVELPERSVPPHARYASIAPDGQRIAWVVAGRDRCALIVRSHDDKGWKDTNTVSETGCISAPAWSPSSDKIAYYFGDPDAVTKDGFCLMLLDTREANREPKRIAPPSLWTRLSPSRPDPPLWSPDGRLILFEARYDPEKPANLERNHVVASDGTGLSPCPRGTWSLDGNRIYVFERRAAQDLDQDTALVVVEMTSQERSQKKLGFVLPKKCAVARCSPTGQGVAYVKDRQLHLASVSTNEDHVLDQVDPTSKIIWVRLSDSPTQTTQP